MFRGTGDAVPHDVSQFLVTAGADERSRWKEQGTCKGTSKTLPKTDNFGWLGGVNSLVPFFVSVSGCEIVNSAFFETAIGFDSNDLSWFSHSVARDARGIRARSKKVRGIQVFLVYSQKSL